MFTIQVSLLYMSTVLLPIASDLAFTPKTSNKLQTNASIVDAAILKAQTNQLSDWLLERVDSYFDWLVKK